MWLYTPGVPGRAFSASIGTALNGDSVIAPTSHGAGLVRVNVMLLPEVVMPDTLWPSTYCFNAAASVAAFAG